jgi:hypothetical protein
VLVVGYALGLCPLPTERRLAVSDPELVLDD